MKTNRRSCLMMSLILSCGILNHANAESLVAQAQHLASVKVDCANNEADAALINSTIAESEKGNEILISGTCLINQTIRLRGERSYRGESREGTELVQASSANLVAIMASDSFLDNNAWTGLPVSVRHLKLRGNGNGNTAGIIMRSWLSTIEDVHVTNGGGDGIRLSNASANGTLLNNTQVNGRISASFIDNSGRHGVYVDDVGNSITDWIISDNWIANSRLDGLRLDNAAGWMIERNHIYGVGQNAIYAHRMWGTTISNNYIEGFGGALQNPDWRGWNGIWASLQGGAAGSTIFANRVFHFAIINNPLTELNYIHLVQNYGTGTVSVTGNTIVGTGESDNSTGLKFAANSGTELNLVSTGNIVRKVHRPLQQTEQVNRTNGY